jgi:hypothetical protein
MRQLKKKLLLVVMLGGLFLSGLFSPITPRAFAQQPTGSVPTVTGTAEGPIVRVDPSIKTQIRVWAGPSSLGEYPAIGVLLANETAPALARAKGKPQWIQIYYPGVPGSVGWVWSIYLIDLRADLPVVEVPATPTPLATPTINPTLVAAFIGQQTPTRLPTFTPPPPIELPQFTDTASNSQNTGVPTGLLILTLGLFGFFGVVLSYLRGR